MPLSSLFEYTPEMSGSPHGVRDGFQFFCGGAGGFFDASFARKLSATSRISFRASSWALACDGLVAAPVCAWPAREGVSETATMTAPTTPVEIEAR
jgi:hypothetical protein